MIVAGVSALQFQVTFLEIVFAVLVYAFIAVMIVSAYTKIDRESRF